MGVRGKRIEQGRGMGNVDGCGRGGMIDGEGEPEKIRVDQNDMHSRGSCVGEHPCLGVWAAADGLCGHRLPASPDTEPCCFRPMIVWCLALLGMSSSCIVGPGKGTFLAYWEAVARKPLSRRQRLSFCN